MNTSFYLKLYFLTVPIFFLIDLIWLGVVAKGFYQKNLKYILSPNVNWTAAIIFYLIYIAGILIFAVVPAVTKDSLRYAVLWGALFGFFTYATYDLTNLALLGSDQRKFRKGNAGSVANVHSNFRKIPGDTGKW